MIHIKMGMLSIEYNISTTTLQYNSSYYTGKRTCFEILSSISNAHNDNRHVIVACGRACRVDNLLLVSTLGFDARPKRGL